MAPPSYRLLTVTTAAAVRALTTRDRVKAVLQIAGDAQDAFLDIAIAQASAAAESYCNRVFAADVLSETVRPAIGASRSGLSGRFSPLQLSRWPLAAIASVTTQDTASDTATTLAEDTDFEADYAAGQLFRLDGNGVPRSWAAIKTVVAYTAGYTLPNVASFTLPADIEDAVIRLVSARVSARSRDPFLKAEETMGVDRVEYWVSAGTGGNMTPDVADLLDNFRVPPL